MPGTGRFFFGYEWRFVVLRLSDWAVLTFLDEIATSKTVTPTLNQPTPATGQVPSDHPEINIDDTDGSPFLEEGVRVLIGLRREGGSPPWKPRFAGLLMQVSDEAETDNAVTNYTAFDPWKILYSRPIMNADGSLPGAEGISFTATDPAVIAATLLKRTIDHEGPVYIDAGGTYSGTAFWGGHLDSVTAIDANFEQATSVGEAWDQLCQMGVIDIQLEPIYDPINRPGYMTELSIYAQRGAERDGAIFAWDRPPNNLLRITRLVDGTQRANKVQFYAGDVSEPATLAQDATSISKYGKYWAQQVWTGQNVAAAVDALANLQLRLRKNGQTTITISPAADEAPVALLEYDVGDRVPVYASKRFRKPMSGYQRVYGIPIQIGDDMIEMVDQLLCSADGVA